MARLEAWLDRIADWSVLNCHPELSDTMLATTVLSVGPILAIDPIHMVADNDFAAGAGE